MVGRPAPPWAPRSAQTAVVVRGGFMVGFGLVQGLGWFRV